LELEVAPLVAERLAGEAALEDLHGLLEAGHALPARHAVGGEVGVLVADAEPQDHAAARDPVEHDDVLGQPHRVVQRCGEDGAAEADAGGALQQAGAQQERRHERAAPRLVELGQEHRVEARRVGGGDLLPQLLPQRVERTRLVLDGEHDPELHGQPRSGGTVEAVYQPTVRLETRSMAPSTVPVPGGRLAVRSLGGGAPLVLLHGGMGTSTHDWGEVAPRLASRWRVTLVDWKAHGASPPGDRRIGVERYALDLAHVLRWLGDVAPVLIGFSLGANAVLHLLAMRPEAARAAVLV